MKKLQNNEFIDFEEDIKEKIEKNLIFEKDVFDFLN